MQRIPSFAFSALVILGTPMSAATPVFSTVNISSQANFTWLSPQLDPNGVTATYFPGGPTGLVTLGEVPFNILSNASGFQAWNGYVASSGGNETVGITVPVGTYGVTDVYTLMNTYWGALNVSYATLVFTGSGGATYTRPLVGGSDIRNWCCGGSINGTSTINVHSVAASPINGLPGYLDMQHVVLPAAFATQTLVSIQLVDSGATGVQRVILDGVTVQSGVSTNIIPGRFIPVTPCRIADTRNPIGAFGGPIMNGGETRSFAVGDSACGIPHTATAYSLNATVVPSGPLSYLTMWPTGQVRPLVSTLNSFDGDVVANAAIVPAGTNSGINVFVTDRTHLVLDINGYFLDPIASPQALAFYTIPPCRVSDTRNAVGPFGGPAISGGQSRNFAVRASACGLPATAQAYSLNVTAVPTNNALAFLTIWPAGQSRPLASTLNSFRGTVVANAAVVPAGTNGDVSVFVTHPSDVILDINGYIAPQGADGLQFYPVPPCRISDTRNAVGPLGGPTMNSGTTRDFNLLLSSCGIPANSQSYSTNVTVVPHVPLSFLTLWPSGQALPPVSTLNSFLGKVVANAAIVPAGGNGAVSVFVTDRTDVIIDVNGYFAP